LPVGARSATSLCNSNDTTGKNKLFILYLFLQ
jgi:hypothetical protein